MSPPAFSTCLARIALIVAQVSKPADLSRLEAAKGIAGAKRRQGPQGRTSGSERTNRRFPNRRAPRFADAVGWQTARGLGSPQCSRLGGLRYVKKIPRSEAGGTNGLVRTHSLRYPKSLPTTRCRPKTGQEILPPVHFFPLSAFRFPLFLVTLSLQWLVFDGNGTPKNVQKK
jgi:hypothetical protein